jgi:Protein of unknown function (DUF2786)
MIDPHIIEKIRKLRALTERRGTTEEEALVAQQRMFALLAKYNLELSQIPDDEPTRPDTSIDAETAERPLNVWKQYLYTAVANLNFTECFTLRAHIYVIGTKANRIATMEMASYLMETVERLANESAAEVPGDERRRFRHSFAEGCAARIYDRIEALQLESQAGRMKATNPDSLLPALADLYHSSKARVDDFIANHFGRISHRTHYASGGHGGGNIAGYAAGGKVGLHRQVGLNARRRLISA